MAAMFGQLSLSEMGNEQKYDQAQERSDLTTHSSQVVELRDYQRAAADAVHAAAERGIQRPLVAMATGLGKSLIASHVVKERGGRAIVLAHRDEILRQLGRSIHMANPYASVGYIKAEEDETRADVVVASIQTLARPARIERLLRDGAFKTIIQDEAHHCLSGDNENTFGLALRRLGGFSEGGPQASAWTATPERGDGKAIGGDLWQEKVYEMGILDGIRAGYLCDLRGIQVQIAADFNALHVRAGDFRDEESAEMLLAADAPKHTVKAWLEHAAGRRTLVFTPTIAVAKEMEQAFRTAGVPAEHVSGEMPMAERRAIAARLRSGETLVAPNAQLWTEGFDLPQIECIVMARPTRSRPFCIQAIGRGTRIYPGKTDCVIIDVVGSTLRKDLVTIAELFDVDRESARGGILQAVTNKLAREQIAPVAPPEGRLRSVEVSLFDRRQFSWVQTRNESFVLSLGEQGNLLLEPDDGADDSWRVVQTWRERILDNGARYARWQTQRDVLHESLSLEFAQGVAEDIVRKAGVKVLNQRDAPWRELPPTDKQRAVLQRKRRWRENMTRGEASDELTKLFVR